MTHPQVFVKADAANSMAIHSLGHLSADVRAAHLLTRSGVRDGDFKPALLALNASRAWIKHVRGAGFDAVDATPPERRPLCSGLPEGLCEATPTGLACADFVQGTDTINPQKEWVDELAYVARAKAMGDIFAGSYETALDS